MLTVAGGVVARLGAKLLERHGPWQPNNAGKWKAWSQLGYDVDDLTNRTAAANDRIRTLVEVTADFSDRVIPAGTGGVIVEAYDTLRRATPSTSRSRTTPSSAATISRTWSWDRSSSRSSSSDSAIDGRRCQGRPGRGVFRSSSPTTQEWRWPALPQKWFRVPNGTPPELERFVNEPEALRQYVKDILERAQEPDAEPIELIDVFFEVGRPVAHVFVRNLDDPITVKAFCRLLHVEGYTELLTAEQVRAAIGRQPDIEPDSTSAS